MTVQLFLVILSCTFVCMAIMLLGMIFGAVLVVRYADVGGDGKLAKKIKTLAGRIDLLRREVVDLKLKEAEVRRLLKIAQDALAENAVLKALVKEFEDADVNDKATIEALQKKVSESEFLDNDQLNADVEAIVGPEEENI